MAMVTSVESTVRTTIRHNDNAPIASEATTARVRRDDATGAAKPSKPVAPGDRTIPKSLIARANHLQRPTNLATIAGNIAAVPPQKRRNGGDASAVLRSRYASYWVA
jgi:hypothetical protein